MELIINISQRDLSYKLDNREGEGLAELIKVASKARIDLITLKGESKSYTFMRQVALFVNMMIKLNECKVVLYSESFKLTRNSIAPIYE